MLPPNLQRQLLGRANTRIPKDRIHGISFQQRDGHAWHAVGKRGNHKGLLADALGRGGAGAEPVEDVRCDIAVIFRALVGTVVGREDFEGEEEWSTV